MYLKQRRQAKESSKVESCGGLKFSILARGMVLQPRKPQIPAMMSSDDYGGNPLKAHVSHQARPYANTFKQNQQKQEEKKTETAKTKIGPRVPWPPLALGARGRCAPAFGNRTLGRLLNQKRKKRRSELL